MQEGARCLLLIAVGVGAPGWTAAAPAGVTAVVAGESTAAQITIRHMHWLPRRGNTNAGLS